MQKLRVLDASRNQLSGTLPQAYANMWELAIVKLNDNTFMQANSTAGSSIPEFFQYLVGNGFKLQCLCVADNSEVLLSEEAKGRLVQTAQHSTPPVQLVVDEPGSRQCDAALLPPA
jgi:hypothetical protein